MIFYNKTNKIQRGSIMVYSLLVIAAIITISFVTLNLLIPKIKIANESINSIVAFYTADSAMEWCLFSNRDNPLALPTVPSQPVFSSIIETGYSIYRGNTVSNCTAGESLDYRTVGTYKGVSRSVCVSEYGGDACDNN